MNHLNLPLIHTEPGKKQRWSGPDDASMALAIAELAQQHSFPIMVIADQFRQLEQLANEIRFFNPTLPVLVFPDLETLPYDHFSVHPDIISQRLDCLYHLPELKRGIVIAPITTLMHRLPPEDYVVSRSLILRQGQKLDRNKLIKDIHASYYHQVNTVMAHGEYALRGSIMDLFPMGSVQPYRIDLFDDTIDSLRTFDTETQKTLEKITEVRLLPALEFPLDQVGIAQFKDNWNHIFPGETRQSTVYKSFSAGQMYPGGEYYMPLFFHRTTSLFAYLPKPSLIFSSNRLEQHARSFYSEVQERYQHLVADKMRPILPVEQLFLNPQDIFTELKVFSQIIYAEQNEPAKHTFHLKTQPLPNLADTDNHQTLSALQGFIKNHPEQKFLFCAESPGRFNRLEELLQKLLESIDPDARPVHFKQWQDFVQSPALYGMSLAPIDRGLWLSQYAVITEAQLFAYIMARKPKARAGKSILAENIIKHLAELSPGDPVVHIEHGIGRFQGLQTLEIDRQKNEFLVILYADDAKLYVPVASLHLINRYSGVEQEQVCLSKLGSGQWEKQKAKARKKILDSASVLLEIYAKRAQKPGYAFIFKSDDHQKFADAFKFVLTTDQEQAINEVMADMQSPRLMDRLICGDVGFGKTEVALRACLMAVSNSKQVILLAPTTLLAQQHFETFRDRFADWPVNIEVLSRFKTSKEQTAILKKFLDGKLDILIGTHKLLQNQLPAKDLGLLIIDEEHRFGVKQKEKLKSLKMDVDILSLTATPIPRTLNMAMSGLRDLSIISTPPDNRLSVRTFLHKDDSVITKEAILRELLRGGQVYLLHNDVKTIGLRAENIRELVPEARIAIAHGQMSERELEKTMSDFYHNRYNLLVCTTIIETGIDIPNANTIIIDRADKFGLAQLHQLRGRVGRSHHQAYAYLFVPDIATLQDKAGKRLEAVCQAQDLGAGFVLATQDMEIRGAGELLGEEQSGHMQAIGFDLYMQLLSQTIEAMKAGVTDINLEQAMQEGCEVELFLSAMLPADYITDIPTRLTYYKRIANSENQAALQDIQIELIDRFGTLPVETKNLFALAVIKQQAYQLGIKKIQSDRQTAKITFYDQPKVKPETVLSLIQQHPETMKITASNQFIFQFNNENTNQAEQIQDLLRALNE